MLGPQILTKALSYVVKKKRREKMVRKENKSCKLDFMLLKHLSSTRRFLSFTILMCQSAFLDMEGFI